MGALAETLGVPADELPSRLVDGHLLSGWERTPRHGGGMLVGRRPVGC